MALEEVAKRYFSSISTIANRICVDQDETRSSYKELWNTLTFQEKEKILSESIITPELCIKYQIESELKTHENINYGSKIIIDDNYSYRDEYSAPFSLRTGSQRKLDIFGTRVGAKHGTNHPCTNIIKDNTPPTTKYSNSKNETLKNESTAPHSSTESLSHFLPKTGLDFLDNW